MAVMASEEPPVLRSDTMTSIDMSSLTQSELHSLSLLSNTTSDDAIPSAVKLNPSLFNESASSRKQTYSDSPHSRRRRRRGFSLLRRERSESNSIVNFLKHYLQLGDNSAQGGRKTKRVGESEGRENVNMEIVNRNGEVVDLAALERESEGGPFGEELRRRAAGMEREQELLAMLAAMEGEWCSRRKKRRVVEASLLGDALPVGWKLIIALRRKGGRFFPYCRRYISPTGEQLACCKEVSSYLQSYFGIKDTRVLRDGRDEEHQHQEIVDVDKHLMSLHQRTTRKYRLGSSVGAGVIIRDGRFECQFCHKVFEERRRYLGHVGNHVRGSARRSEASPVQLMGSPRKDQLPANTGISKMAALIEIAQSSIQSISPSNVSNVDDVSMEEDARAIHADSNTKESSGFCLNENGSTEVKCFPEKLDPMNRPTETCTACPDETLMEKYTREDNVSPKELNPPYDMVIEISKMDEDTVNDSTVCLHELEVRKADCKHRCSSEELHTHSKVRKTSMIDGNMTCSSACPYELAIKKYHGEGKTLAGELHPHDKRSDRECMEQLFTFDTTIIPANEAGLHAENNKANFEWEYTAAENNRSTGEPKEILGIHYLFNKKSSAVDGAEDMIDANHAAECESQHEQEPDDKELASVSVESRPSDHTVPQTSFNASSTFDEILGKEDQNRGNVMRPEYMKLDAADTQMYDAMTGEDIFSLSAISMGFENNTEAGLDLDTTVGSQLEFPIEMPCKSVTTTLCVWCGGEFCHEIVDIELQPDSVGFMCPTCRNKISKQFNDLECNFSLSSHYY